MNLHISPSSGVPIYLQIVNQIKYLVSSGQLESGQELPPIRTLAEKLLVNPNTVARAYRELEFARIVNKRGTTGTFISNTGSPLARRERMKIVTERADALLAEAQQMGVEIDDLIDLLRQRADAMKSTVERK